METTVPKKNYWGPILSTHPQNYRELIKRSLRLYFASFGQIIFYAFLFSLLVFLPRLLSYVFDRDLIPTNRVSALDLAYIALLDFAALIVLVVMFNKLHHVAHYRAPNFKIELNVNLRKVLSIFIACLIQNMIVFGAIFLTFWVQYFLLQHQLLFPHPNSLSLGTVIIIITFALQAAFMLYFTTLFLFLIPLIAIEDEGILTSILRSISLTWNHWWRVFTTQLTPWLCFVLFTIFIRFIVDINIHVYFIGHAREHLHSTLLQIILLTLFVIWPLALLYIQLKDLELRKKQT